MSQNHPLSRRKFLGVTAGAVAAPFVVPSSILGLGSQTSPG